MCRNLLITVLATAAIIPSAAQQRREKEPLCEQNGAERVQISDADATILDFTLGNTSLKDVQQRMGSAKVERVTKAEESDIAICYVSPKDGTVLIFYSGAMGGWEDLTWFALWSRKAAYPRVASCTPSESVFHNLTTRSGLRLGLSQREANQISGTPTKISRSTMKYDYICRQRMTEEQIKKFKAVNNWDASDDPYFDRVSWADIHVGREGAFRIEVGRYESY